MEGIIAIDRIRGQFHGDLPLFCPEYDHAGRDARLLRKKRHQDAL